MSILQKYGIKEVADVTFYSIDDTGRPVSPVLFLDTLKVSTIEQTAEEAEARGGKGNGLLILWDYGKDINVSLEDALFSAKSLAIMFGGGEIKKMGIPEGTRFMSTVDDSVYYINVAGTHILGEWINFDPEKSIIKDGQILTLPNWYAGDEEEGESFIREVVLEHVVGSDDSGETKDGWVVRDDLGHGDLFFPLYGPYHPQDSLIMKSEFFHATKNVTSFVEPYDWGWSPDFSQNGKSYTKINPLFFSAKGEKVTSLEEGEEYFCTYDLVMSSAQVIEISAKTFPGIYYITGTTYCRNQDSGKDEMFEFIIPKAKVQSENTITLEAEGDPSVFNMNLRVLRDKKGGMMKLVKYELDGGDETEELKSELIHNHQLEGENYVPPPLRLYFYDLPSEIDFGEGTWQVADPFTILINGTSQLYENVSDTPWPESSYISLEMQVDYPCSMTIPTQLLGTFISDDPDWPIREDFFISIPTTTITQSETDFKYPFN